MLNFSSDVLSRHALLHDIDSLQQDEPSEYRSNGSRIRACTECARARVRCAKGVPCLRCQTRNLECKVISREGNASIEPNDTTSNVSRAHVDMISWTTPSHPLSQRSQSTSSFDNDNLAASVVVMQNSADVNETPSIRRSLASSSSFPSEYHIRCDCTNSPHWATERLSRQTIKMLR